jgi:HSP20 family protein
MQADVNRLSEETRFAGAAEYPPTNIWSGIEGVVVTAHIPGVEKDEIEVTVQEDTLTIKGKREVKDEGESSTYHRRERQHGSFVRTIVLPYAVDADKTDAIFELGVLAVRLVRPEEDRPKRIEISGL